MTDAIVLSGGGVAGVAWQVGVLRGIVDASPELAESLRRAGTLFVGTSAGSVVASQFAGGVPLDRLYDLQLTADAAIGARVDMSSLGTVASQLLAGASDMNDVRARLGGLVRSGFAADDVDRRLVFARSLPVQEWPQAPLKIAAVEVESQQLRVFDRDSGVSLVDAVAASCAVPLLWPAVEIQGKHYVDGGLRSSANVDLARGSDRVLLVLASAGADRSQLAALGDARVLTIAADAASLRARGSNSLDVAASADSAAAGRAQGAGLAAEIARFWA
jgi:NTE family protein